MNKIREIRQKVGMTQSALAEKAQISQPYLYDLENNRRGAKSDTLARIAIALGVQVTELIKDDENSVSA